MPPQPPSASTPLKERLLALAQTLQFAWFTGHLTLIACTIRYALSLIRFNMYGAVARFSYRLSFVAAAVTYGIVVYKGWRSRARQGSKAPSGVVSIMADENVQYLGMALVWMLSPQYPLALLPYSIYSIFHVLSYTRSAVIPTVQPPQPAAGGATSVQGKPQFAPNPTADAIGNFVKTYYEASMSVVSGLEILLWIRLIVAAVIFTRRSWILLGIYTVFLRARFSQSPHVKNSFAVLESKIDGLVANPNLPPAARQVWDGVKGGARSFHSMTDVNQYMNGAAVPKKTS